MESGLMPCMGAGTDALTEHFGFPVPGVYVAPSVRAAMQYPIAPTTLNVTVPGQRKKSMIPGGTLIARDGSAPLR
eukprot:8798620-Lingulodinium_polyedra.AAC.1